MFLDWLNDWTIKRSDFNWIPFALMVHFNFDVEVEISILKVDLLQMNVVLRVLNQKQFWW